MTSAADMDPAALLGNACAAVYDGTKPVGTAFFVSADVLATCGHVAKHLKGNFTIRFKGYDVRAAVIAMPAPQEKEDVAFIRLSESVVHLEPRILSLDDQIAAMPVGASCYTYGFASGKDEPVLLTYEGQHQDEPRFLKFKEGQLVPGMSGSPVLCLATKRICGMVRTTRDPNSDLGGGAVPISIVAARFRMLSSAPNISAVNDSVLLKKSNKHLCRFGTLGGKCCAWPSTDLEHLATQQTYAYAKKIAHLICHEKCLLLVAAPLLVIAPLVEHWIFPEVSTSFVFATEAFAVLVAFILVFCVLWMHQGARELLELRAGIPTGTPELVRSAIRKSADCALITRTLGPKRLEY